MPVTTSLQTRIANFVAAIDGMSNGGAIAIRWKREIRQHEGRTPNTLKLYVSLYRKAIREAQGEDALALKYVKPDPKLAAEVRETYKARVATQNRNLVHIQRWPELRRTAITLLDSADPLEIAVGLLLLTGRRSYEICCIGRFDLIPVQLATTAAHDRWHLNFSGQAKTRGAAGTKAGQAYTIPCLASATAILRAHKRFKTSTIGQSLNDISNTDFTKRIAHRINNVAKIACARFFPAEASFSTKSLRALYAEIAYNYFATPDNTKSAFFSIILGHQDWDLETSLSYFDYYIGDPDHAKKAVEQAQAQLVEAAKGRGDKWAEEPAHEQDDADPASNDTPAE